MLRFGITTHGSFLKPSRSLGAVNPTLRVERPRLPTVDIQITDRLPEPVAVPSAAMDPGLRDSLAFLPPELLTVDVFPNAPLFFNPGG